MVVPKPILAECERGESEAVERYREAITEMLPPETSHLVSQQYKQIEAAHEHVVRLQRIAD